MHARTHARRACNSRGQTCRDYNTRGLVHGGTATPGDWFTVGLQRQGTGTRWIATPGDWYTMGLQHPATGTRWDCNTRGLLHGGTATPGDWYTAGLQLKGTCTRWDCYTRGLTRRNYNARGLVHDEGLLCRNPIVSQTRGTGTQLDMSERDWYSTRGELIGTGIQ